MSEPLRAYVFDASGRCYGRRVCVPELINVGAAPGEVGWLLTADLPEFTAPADVPPLGELAGHEVDPVTRQITLLVRP